MKRKMTMPPKGLLAWPHSGSTAVLVADPVRSVILAEAKSGATVGRDFTESVDRLARSYRQRDSARVVTARVVYGGATRHTRGGTEIIPWGAIDQVEW